MLKTPEDAAEPYEWEQDIDYGEFWYRPRSPRCSGSQKSNLGRQAPFVLWGVQQKKFLICTSCETTGKRFAFARFA